MTAKEKIVNALSKLEDMNNFMIFEIGKINGRKDMVACAEKNGKHIYMYPHIDEHGECTIRRMVTPTMDELKKTYPNFKDIFIKHLLMSNIYVEESVDIKSQLLYWLTGKENMEFPFSFSEIPGLYVFVYHELTDIRKVSTETVFSDDAPTPTAKDKFLSRVKELELTDKWNASSEIKGIRCAGKFQNSEAVVLTKTGNVYREIHYPGPRLILEDENKKVEIVKGYAQALTLGYITEEEFNKVYLWTLHGKRFPTRNFIGFALSNGLSLDEPFVFKD